MKLLLPLLVLSLLSACATKDTAEPPAELLDFKVETALKSQWSVDTGSSVSQLGIKSEPYISGEQMYTASFSGVISRVDLNKRKVEQSLQTEDKISAGLTGSAEKLFYGTNNGDLVAIEASNFKSAWRVPLRSEILAKPVADAGIVVARTVDGNIQAFDTNSGEKRWAHKMTVPALSLRGNSQPVLVDSSLLIVGSDNGRLLGLNLQNGRVLFETPLVLPSGSNVIARLSDIDMTPSFDGSTLYVSAYQNGMSAVDLQRGSIRWRHPASTYEKIAYTDKRLYLSDSDGQVWALNRQTGETVWVQKGLRARNVSAPVIHDSKILVADYEGYLHALSEADGRFVARKQINKSGYLNSPFVAGSAIYLLGKDGLLTSLDFITKQTAAK